MASPLLPSVDVVIPCYNEHDALAGCLDSLLAQKEDIARIILVDNNSTDDTADIIKRYQKKHPRLITYLFEEKQGVQYARNKGFDASTADIIARTDADVRAQPDWIIEIRRGYHNHPEFMAASGLVDYYDLPFRWFTRIMTWVFIFASNALFTRTNTLYGSNMTIRREAWQKVKSDVLMADNIMEDTALSLALNRANLYIGHIRSSYASASGRRLRNTPPLFWKYNSLWWRTYEKSGYHGKAAGIRAIVWLGNCIQAICWVGLLFHDPVSRKWRIGHLLKDSNHNRILP